jgi:alkylhydroperoxidase/carboxymuconolactone decarboxylase family protein YurZ
MHSSPEDALAKFAEGGLSRADVAQRDLLSRPTRRLIGLAALVAMGQFEDFDEQARLACNDDVQPEQIMEMLGELADIGIRPPEPVLASVRAIAREPT